MIDVKNPLDSSFAKLVQATLGHWHVPGVSIAVVDGESTWAEGYGVATFPSEPATASTLYEVGSTTKAFTAAAVGLLVDDGKLNWKTPVASLLQDNFVLPDDAEGQSITIEDALSHRTGMPRHDIFYGGKSVSTAGEVTRKLRYLQRVAPLRSTYIYCNTMYMVVARVIEKVTELQVGNFLQTRIFKPLSMAATYTTLPAARVSPEHFATGYYYDEITSQFMEVPPLENRGCIGPGGLLSNVLDFAKWVRVLLKQKGPFSQSCHDSFRTSRIAEPSNRASLPFSGPLEYCIGWKTSHYQGRKFFFHTGGVTAYGAMVIWIPSLDYGVIGFANTAITSRYILDRLLWHLVDDKIGVPLAQRYDWNQRNHQTVERDAAERLKAVEICYPQVRNPGAPLSLPIAEYAGRYHHPAYQDIEILCIADQLQIIRTDTQWKVRIELEHISGDDFLGRMKSIDNPATDLFAGASFWPAQFRIGANGKPKDFGARIEKDMGDQKLWFERI